MLQCCHVCSALHTPALWSHLSCFRPYTTWFLNHVDTPLGCAQQLHRLIMDLYIRTKVSGKFNLLLVEFGCQRQVWTHQLCVQFGDGSFFSMCQTFLASLYLTWQQVKFREHAPTDGHFVVFFASCTESRYHSVSILTPHAARIEGPYGMAQHELSNMADLLER